MALVKCDECGKEKSSAAKVCPHCGKSRDHISSGVIWFVVLGLVVFFGVMAMNG
ncbi:zinc ribbon domain-containing protein [Shewanella sp. H8]|uniref:zinc ribbon domain-containing protein n=1 Tax=Shewanella sp. H8 TaxID=3342676 RepID=UPI0033152F7B